MQWRRTPIARSGSPRFAAPRRRDELLKTGAAAAGKRILFSRVEPGQVISAGFGGCETKGRRRAGWWQAVWAGLRAAGNRSRWNWSEEACTLEPAAKDDPCMFHPTPEAAKDIDELTPEKTGWCSSKSR
jgi:hypothetical protein